jgi:hypothetical protein
MTRIPLAVLLVFGVTLLAGCCGKPPRDAQMALARVNNNLAQIATPIQHKGWVSVRFKDADDKTRRFLSDDASLLFANPRFLRFEIRHALAGTVAEFGSNDTHYWLAVDPEVQKLWWGEWATLAAGGQSRLAIEPRDLLDALMLRPLPASVEGRPPRLEKRWPWYWLIYERAATGVPGRTLREVKLSCQPPYQPIKVVDKLADGRVAMKAELKRWRRLEDTDIFVPTRYVITWPLDDAKLNLDVHRAKRRPDIEDEVFAFPAGWQGAEERVDVPLDTLSDNGRGMPRP